MQSSHIILHVIEIGNCEQNNSSSRQADNMYITYSVGMLLKEPGKAASKIRHWPRKAASTGTWIGQGHLCAGKWRPEYKKTALPVLADK
jgi:hypothetical protein